MVTDLLKNYLCGLNPCGSAQAFDSLIVCGPEMAPQRRADIGQIAAGRAHVQVREFVNDMLGYIDAADVVVSMGGYNTICELLSLHKHAVIVPRAKPVEEQWIRAERMANLGLFRVIHPDFVTPANLRGAVAELIGVNGKQSLPPSLDLAALPHIAGHIARLLSDASGTTTGEGTAARDGTRTVLRMNAPRAGKRIAYLVKTFPKISETFILREILALQDQDVDLQIYALRHPEESKSHSIDSEVRAPVSYLPRSFAEKAASMLWAQLLLLLCRPAAYLHAMVFLVGRAESGRYQIFFRPPIWRWRC